MIANKEREIFNNKYNFLTELKLVRSLSSKKGRRKLKLAKLEESIKRMVRSRIYVYSILVIRNWYS